MECRIEAGDRGDVRPHLPNGANSGKIVWLMQRRQGNKLAQVRLDGHCHNHCAVMLTAMHDPVPHGGQGWSVLLSQFEYLRQCFLVARERIGLVDHRAALTVDDMEACILNTDPVDRA